MPRFFNRIRKQLAKENKFFQYSRYAIGEILLVVIGILIAIQVDNWNDNRIEKKSQQAALYKLKGDLESDMRLFKRLDSTYIEWQKQADGMYEQLISQSKERLEHDEFIVGRGSMHNVNLRTVTIDEMINTGLFYRIQSHTASQLISDYYEFANYQIEKLNADNRDLYAWVLQVSVIEESTTLAARLYSQENLEFIDWSWLKDPSSKKYKYFEARIHYFRVALEENRRVLGELIKKAGLVLKELDRPI